MKVIQWLQFSSIAYHSKIVNLSIATELFYHPFLCSQFHGFHLTFVTQSVCVASQQYIQQYQPGMYGMSLQCVILPKFVHFMLHDPFNSD